MKCLRCGFNNPEGMKFCGQCGATLVRDTEQGTDLIQSTLPEAMRSKILAAKIGGERKKVTVVFTDVSGFTALAEKLDPEEVRELINSLFRELIEVVYKYEGTIDKFIGDCIMALFGAPLVHEDDPERALHTALEIMGAVERFNEKRQIDLSVHIGINSGTVVVGGVGSDLRMDYTVMGDTVNVASRLMELAKNDEILVSESVQRITEYLFNMEKLRPVSVKGKTEKIVPYRVVGIKEKPQRKRGIAELSSPLVGRIKEFSLLRSAVEYLNENKAEVISLIGEAGLGKSRIIEEVKRETGDKAVWMGGKCFSYDKTFPFSVFLDQLRSYCEINELDSNPAAREKLRHWVQYFLKEKADKYFTYLCLFLSIDVPVELKDKVKHLDPKSLRLEMYVSIKAFLKEMTKAKPVVLYFEDMHWIDPESVDLILFLLDVLKNEHILFLFETRPEQETGFYRIRQAIQMIYKKRYTEIRLPPLSTVDVTTLVVNLLSIPGLPSDPLSLIFEKSEGNPFYIEEILRSFIDQGLLKQKRETWQFVSDVSSFEVPDTVEAVIRSRVDRLASEPREVLEHAAVIGRSFPYPILFCNTIVKKIEKSIEILNTSEFITKIDTPEPEFRHILIRDVAYNGLLIKKRREIHKKTAECIEKIFKKKIEDYYEILAYHYYNAKIYDKSYEYYQKAADQAKESYHNDVAIKCYTRAIEVYTKVYSDVDRVHMAKLYEKRGDVRELKSEYDCVFDDYEHAFECYSDIEQRANIKRKIGKIFFNKAEYTTAISCYENAMKIVKDVPNSVIVAEILIDYAWLLAHGKGDYKQAEKRIVDAFKNIDERKNPRVYARGLKNLGYIAFRKGDYDQALQYYKKTMSIMTQFNDKKDIGGMYNNLGLVYFSKGEFDDALTYYQKGLNILQEIDHTMGIAKASLNIGLLYRNKGELDTALDYYQKCLAVSEEVGDKNAIGVAYNNIGGIYNSRGEFTTAMKYYQQHLATSEEIGNKNGIGTASHNIGDVYRAWGDIENALKFYTRHLTISEELDDKMGIGHAYIKIGAIYREKKEFEQSMDYLKKAEKLLSETGHKIGLSEVYTSISELYTEQKKYKDACKCAEKAQSLAKKVGAGSREIPALRAMGRALSECDAEKAKTVLEQSIELAEKEGVNWDLALSHYELAKVLYTRGNIDEAKQHSNKAKKIFENSGAQAWLEKIKTLLDTLDRGK
jgi:class 3 adenylate cyclase/tetratricopeptide (TPR) repeat protein